MSGTEAPHPTANLDRVFPDSQQTQVRDPRLLPKVVEIVEQSIDNHS